MENLLPSAVVQLSKGMHRCRTKVLFEDKILDTTYYHRMPQKLAKLLDGTRAMVVVQNAKMLRMIYNTCGWVPVNAEDKTGRYGFEPPDHVCYSWFKNDELAFVTYIDQLVTEQPLN